VLALEHRIQLASNLFGSAFRFQDLGLGFELQLAPDLGLGFEG
jgi:hypothetical protein